MPAESPLPIPVECYELLEFLKNSPTPVRREDVSSDALKYCGIRRWIESYNADIERDYPGAYLRRSRRGKRYYYPEEDRPFGRVIFLTHVRLSHRGKARLIEHQMRSRERENAQGDVRPPNIATGQSAASETPAAPEIGAATERLGMSGVPAGTGIVRLSNESEERAGGSSLPNITAHVFGITVDHVNRRVRREGYDREVDLFRTQVGWHIFKVILSAAPEQATLDALEPDYPGEFDARATAINGLNRKLRPLNIKVRDRTLALLD